MNTSNTPVMKRQRTEVISNQDTDAVDRLSDLPDEIILEIFSTLTTETTVITSILSKRWIGLWREMRSLRFENKLHKHNFSDNVISALLSYQHSTIENLTIGVDDKCDPKDFTIWFAIAFAKHVSKLVLRLDNNSKNITFPDGALNRKNTLKVLKLMGRMYIHFPLPTVTLNCLKELHLHHVKFHNRNSVYHLLKGCPVLEVLVIVIRVSSGIAKIRINSPSLLKLSLTVHNSIDQSFFIRTPRLEYLDIRKFEGVDSFIMDNAPKLKVAKINDHNEDMLDNILDTIPSVEHLTISAPLMYPSDKTYHGLKTLEIQTNDRDWCKLLNFMLIHSPNLEKLIITGGWYNFWGNKWNPPEHVSSTLMSRINTLVWKRYVLDQSEDRDVAIFILKNAQQLRNATFSVYKSSNKMQIQLRNQMMSSLLQARASTLCQIVFRDFTHCENPSTIDDLDPDFQDFSY